MTRENLPRQTLQKRLLLGLYGLGTNTGFKRIAAGDSDVKYKDLLYVRRRFLITEHLRAAIAQVVNAIFRARLPHIWGEGTTACASDSKKFAEKCRLCLHFFGTRTFLPNGIFVIKVRESWCIGTSKKKLPVSNVGNDIDKMETLKIIYYEYVASARP